MLKIRAEILLIFLKVLLEIKGSSSINLNGNVLGNSSLSNYIQQYLKPQRKYMQIEIFYK